MVWHILIRLAQVVAFGVFKLLSPPDLAQPRRNASLTQTLGAVGTREATGENQHVVFGEKPPGQLLVAQDEGFV